MQIHILPLSEIDRVVKLSLALPEFDQPYGVEEYQKRLSTVPHLILVAEKHGRDIAFKVGYEREKDGSFYSWMGGVLPQYRRQAVAMMLAGRQENWARQQGYKSIRFKTLNRHRNMLLFAIERGFQIIHLETLPHRDDNLIWLEKAL